MGGRGGGERGGADTIPGQVHHALEETTLPPAALPTGECSETNLCIVGSFLASSGEYYSLFGKCWDFSKRF